MKKNNRSIKREGFTLVELLIVIVVIGILSAMMMLSSTEAVSSARASNIVSNLRNLKTAALAFYVDHVDSYDKDDVSDDISSKSTEIMNYMSSGAQQVGSEYAFSGDKSGTWAVICTVSDTKVWEKLSGRASAVGLDMDTSNKKVIMKIR
ncbi:MAG: type II secretion system protein [Synergistaceae bacterium]|nr:type II secretion system protein [Synergistaceae bacterium]